MTRLEASDVTVRLEGQTIVDNVSLTLTDGQWLMLCGPNGAGKSTLLSALCQTRPSIGKITLDGVDLRSMKPVALAQQVGVLSQHSGVQYGFTVEEVVAMGRYCHRRSIFGDGDASGEEHVSAALAAVGMTELRRHSMLTLSGGERQRAFLAQVLCQDPRILMLDEPSNHLDLNYQKQLFTLIDHWRQTPGRAVISVVHDLSLARRFGTHALLMDHGRCAAFGHQRDVLTSDRLAQVWGMDVRGWMTELLDGWNKA